jgi:hypothetical protein
MQELAAGFENQDAAYPVDTTRGIPLKPRLP